MRYVFALVGIFMSGLAAAQPTMSENVDFDNYNLIPALADPDNRLNSDLIYQNTTIEEWEYRLIKGQANFWIDNRNNVGISWNRNNSRAVNGDNQTNYNTSELRISYAHRFSIAGVDFIPAIDFNHFEVLGEDRFQEYNSNYYQFPLYSSLGLGVRTDELTAGFYFTHALEFADNDHPIGTAWGASAFISHLAYKLELSPELEIEPFGRLRVPTNSLQGSQTIISGGVNANYLEKYRLGLGYMENLNRYELSDLTFGERVPSYHQIRVNVGFQPVNNLWVNYQYNHAIEKDLPAVVDQILYTVRHNIGVSYNLPFKPDKSL